MSFTAIDVKTLREKTGAGMMDCKRALSEASGDFTKAVELLRKQGLSIAAKKAGRVASEGIVGSWIDGQNQSGVLVEINCETDFVAKTDDFHSFVNRITTVVAEQKPETMDDLLALSSNGETVQETVTNVIAKLGENLGIRRFIRFVAKNADEQVAQYLHAGAKIGVMVAFADPAKKLDPAVAREVAMHVAAMNPQYLRRGDVPANVLEKEKEILLAQMADQKKPAEILEKIVTGRLSKFYTETCLDEQPYVRDPNGKLSVAAMLKGIDPSIKIMKFVRYQVGEGIEK
ncbi:MAG: elongation factor Ts [Deltaproteobacteria bacterium]|nr:elongation factor Ts [Deltaproteobacteria bacterium]